MIDLATRTDEALVERAKAARAAAEQVEADASPCRWDEADSYAELSERGWSVRRIAGACGTNKDSVSIMCRMVSRYLDDRPPFWHAYAEITGERTTAERLVASNENEWHTPARYLDAAREVLGAIDLDPASSPAANATVEAAGIYTAEEDGLQFPWHGRVWLNPPYGRLAGGFAAHLVDEYQAGHVSAAILLVNAHCTDTAWFQRLWDYPLCFTDHRIDFCSTWDKTSTSTHGSVFAYLGPDPPGFAEAFSPFGAVVERWLP